MPIKYQALPQRYQAIIVDRKQAVNRNRQEPTFMKFTFGLKRYLKCLTNKYTVYQVVINAMKKEQAQQKESEKGAILMLAREILMMKWHLSRDPNEVRKRALLSGRSIPGRRNCKCKGPEVSTCLVV